jgi:hypothetical protein
MNVLVLDDREQHHDRFRFTHRHHKLTHTYRVAAAIRELSNGKHYDEVYLDYDLGEVATGKEVVDHIIHMQPDKRPKKVFVHSPHLMGPQEMVDRLRLHDIFAEHITIY